jgi:hypothetical protein
MVIENLFVQIHNIRGDIIYRNSLPPLLVLFSDQQPRAGHATRNQTHDPKGMT